MSEEVFLSVIIPAYNEGKRLYPTLVRVHDFLEKKGFAYEILVVDDGSKDNTIDVVENYKKTCPYVKLAKNSKNMGKGFSVRNGMLRAKGEYRLFTDSDLSTPIADFDKLMVKIQEGYDIAIGSRALATSNIKVKQPWYRVMMGRTFNWMVRVIFNTKIKDTQCGFKLFTKEASEVIFPKQSVWRFGFDVEIISIGEKLGFKVAEVPVEWANDEESKVSVIKDTISMFLDLLRIRWRLRKIGKGEG